MENVTPERLKEYGFSKWEIPGKFTRYYYNGVAPKGKWWVEINEGRIEGNGRMEFYSPVKMSATISEMVEKFDRCINTNF